MDLLSVYMVLGAVRLAAWLFHNNASNLLNMVTMVAKTHKILFNQTEKRSVACNSFVACFYVHFDPIDPYSIRIALFLSSIFNDKYLFIVH